MFRVTKLCRHLNVYIQNQDRNNLVFSDLKEKLRRNLRVDEIPQFTAYFKESTVDHRDVKDIEDELWDACAADFLAKTSYTMPYGNSISLLGLGPKGRNLLRGNLIKRWAYFIQYAFQEHSVVWTFILGGVSLLALVQFLPSALTPLIALFDTMHL